MFCDPNLKNREIIEAIWKSKLNCGLDAQPRASAVRSWAGEGGSLAAARRKTHIFVALAGDIHTACLEKLRVRR
jgi:hypothetical protein